LSTVSVHNATLVDARTASVALSTSGRINVLNTTLAPAKPASASAEAQPRSEPSFNGPLS
jgi:hypothetical protein